MTDRGRLYLIPNLLGMVKPVSVLPARTIEIARALTHFVVETPKAARVFVKSLVPLHPLQQIAMVAISRESSESEIAEMLAPTTEGRDVGLISDAGCPGIADPGANLVAAAHRQGVVVVPLVGPSALLLALMASGMNGQNFAFHGYLPVREDARTAALTRLEAESRAHGRTQLFIETPYRNRAMLEAMTVTLRAETRVCVAADLTLPTETVVSQSIAHWRTTDCSVYAKRPALFVLQA